MMIQRIYQPTAIMLDQWSVLKLVCLDFMDAYNATKKLEAENDLTPCPILDFLLCISWQGESLRELKELSPLHSVVFKTQAGVKMNAEDAYGAWVMTYEAYECYVYFRGIFQDTQLSGKEPYYDVGTIMSDSVILNHNKNK